MLRNAHNSLILPLPQIAQVIVGSLSFLFFSVLRMAALRLPPCGTLSKATGFLHVPLSVAMLRFLFGVGAIQSGILRLYVIQM